MEQTASYTFVNLSRSLSFLEEICTTGQYGFPTLQGHNDKISSSGTAPDDETILIQKAQHNELLALADELTASWNPVRTFGSGAGTMRIPSAAREMVRWTHRTLQAVETFLQDHPPLRSGQATIAEITLYQFLEFTRDCYGIDMTKGSGETVVDVYGREALQEYPRLTQFCEEFGTRDSARRDADAGEVPGAEVTRRMRDWSVGIFD